MNNKQDWEIRLNKRIRRDNIMAVVEAAAVLLFLVAFVLGMLLLVLDAFTAYREQEREETPQEDAEPVTASSVVYMSAVPLDTVPPVTGYGAETAISGAGSVKTVRYALTDHQRDIVERVVMSEAGGEDFDGQCLVAQCILNSAEAEGVTPDAVVSERGQYASPASCASDSVKSAVAAVFDDGYEVTSERIRWFYAPASCVSRWHETALCFVLEHGGHRFFK